MSTERVIVQKTVVKEFRELFAKAASKMHGGCLVTAGAAHKNRELITDARAKGARVLHKSPSPLTTIPIPISTPLRSPSPGPFPYGFSVENSPLPRPLVSPELESESSESSSLSDSHLHNHPTSYPYYYPDDSSPNSNSNSTSTSISTSTSTGDDSYPFPYSDSNDSDEYHSPPPYHYPHRSSPHQSSSSEGEIESPSPSPTEATVYEATSLSDAEMPITIVDGVTSDMNLYDTESFGPTTALIEVDTEEEAITTANDSQFGLSSAVFTKDLFRGLRIAKKLETGLVYPYILFSSMTLLLYVINVLYI